MSQDLESSIALGIHLVHVQGVVMHLRQATHIITYGRPLVVVVVVEVVVYCLKVFKYTRSYAALRAADLDWIVRPGYSLGQVHSGEKP